MTPTPTPTQQTWAKIVATRSSTTTITAKNATSTRIIVQNPYQRSLHSLNVISEERSSNNGKTNNSDLDTQHTQHTQHQNQANSILTSTPKHRRRRKRKKSNKSYLISSLHHPQYKCLLIDGYIRYKNDLNSFPNDISKLILQFYDEITYWTIEGEELNKFKSLSNGQAMYGPKFNINMILFESTLCPCGWKPNQNGSVQYYIELKSLPYNVSSITVYYELFCKQTQSFCKKIRRFNKATDAQSWGTNNMRLDECFNCNILEFASLVKILHIEYKSGYNVNDIYVECDNTQLKEWTDYCWKIDGKLLEKFISCLDGKFFYSPNFGNNCFSFEIAPNGWHANNRGKLMLYLRLLRLPEKIKKIYCVCHFGAQGNINNKLLGEYNCSHTFCYELHGLQWPLETLTFNSLKSLKSIRFAVKIRIMKVIDINGKYISRNEWQDYDILTNCKSI